jgi:hypothetical protein
MGEIKSTLDLIMERTKNLSMSPEEKEENHRQEWLKKARGWIQRFLDEVVPLEKVREEFSSRALPEGWQGILKKELVNGLEPGRNNNNEKRLLLMETLLNISEAPYREILLSFDRRVEEEGERQKVGIVERWKGKGFSGSALAPNLEGDSLWKDFYLEAIKDSKEKMAEL